MAMRMLTPWKNPRSENLWFRRRVPANLVAFMGRREIKFSLGTSDSELAKLRCQEENVKLERMWHEHLNGRTYTVLSQRQISALAGKREIMRLGGFDHDRDRVFLLSPRPARILVDLPIRTPRNARCEAEIAAIKQL